jgi:hypothetical protein
MKFGLLSTLFMILTFVWIIGLVVARTRFCHTHRKYKNRRVSPEVYEGPERRRCSKCALYGQCDGITCTVRDTNANTEDMALGSF